MPSVKDFTLKEFGDAVVDGAATITELACCFGMSNRQVQRIIEVWETSGLVEETGSRYQLSLDGENHLCGVE